MKLKNLVNYEEGKVVQKIVSGNNSGAVILMAFDADTTIPTHTAPADAMVMILEGELEFTLDGALNLLAEGDFIQMKPGQPHSLSASKRCKMMLIKLNS